METTLSSKIKVLEENTGHEYTEPEIVYAQHLAATGNQALAAREAGSTAISAGSTGRKLALRPEIQALVDTVREFQAEAMDADTIRAAVAKEALTAEASRDRLNALTLLGKDKGMFKDGIDLTVRRPDNNLLDDIEGQFGQEAREKAERELGYE